MNRNSVEMSDMVQLSTTRKRMDWLYSLALAGYMHLTLHPVLMPDYIGDAMDEAQKALKDLSKVLGKSFDGEV